MIHCEITPFNAFVKEKYLYDMDESKTSLIPCEVFAVSSYVDHYPTFQILINNQAMFSYIPAQAIMKTSKQSGIQLNSDKLVYHKCKSERICFNQYQYLKNKEANIFIGSNIVAASYHGTIDWYDSNELLHIMFLENSQIAMLPSHQVLFNKYCKVLPTYKKLHAVFK